MSVFPNFVTSTNKFDKSGRGMGRYGRPSAVAARLLEWIRTMGHMLRFGRKRESSVA